MNPKCSVFGECGGCLHQDKSYADELALKEAYLKHLLISATELSEDVFQAIVPSPKEYHYRHRVDLKLMYLKRGDVLIGYTPVSGRGIVEVDCCPIALDAVSDFIPRLKEVATERIKVAAANSSGGRKHRYRQASLVVRTGDDSRVFWGGIGRKSLRMKEEDYLWTEINGRKIFYSLETFFQGNLSILPKLFDVIKGFDCWTGEETFYDLYGGVGLFSLALIDHFKKFVLIENCGPSVDLARYNKKVHSLDQLEVVEGPVEDHLAERLKNDPGSKIAMIDPPRAGLSDSACEMLAGIQGAEHLMYLSCNPEALARDLQVFMKNGWLVRKVVPFDFFPKTKHLETLVLLEKG